MTLRPCILCGVPTEDASRCPDCRPPVHALSSTARGYDDAWRRLSKRARRLQPWCLDCGSVDDLTTDHSEQAWQRKAQGLEIRLQDVTVVCRSCNGKRGKARPSSTTSTTTPRRPGSPPSRPPGKPRSALHTPGGYA